MTESSYLSKHNTSSNYTSSIHKTLKVNLKGRNTGRGLYLGKILYLAVYHIRIAVLPLKVSMYIYDINNILRIA